MWVFVIALLLTTAARAAAGYIQDGATDGAFAIATAGKASTVYVDAKDFPGVLRATNDLAEDVERVTNVRSPIVHSIQSPTPQFILIGTLGHSALIDQLAADKKIDAGAIAGKWEASLTQVVANPLPGVDSALVIAGSDQRGTIYGIYELSEQIGVSPWYWWADVPVKHRDSLFVKPGVYIQNSPGVKYRGIFINDEDWGLNPWAKLTFDPQFKNIGPKTYEKVFELLLRLRLNYIWPAMHACSAEFASVPENAALAAKFGIVVGSSHCEPMLCNNINWDEKTQGKWDYTVNRDRIRAYWEDSAKTRGNYEAVWTLGIRGIHDRAMEGPKDIPTRIRTVSQVIGDQRELIDRYVSKQWGPVAQCFVPYKEVLPIYNAGLKVPPDVTLVWVDDNFGYIRRLSSPEERKRPGGAGVYYHISYYGGPHSYTWINTTAPALMWEELHKAWENDARTLWMLNVGDIKPMEIGIDYYARLAWNPEAMGADSQPKFLREFVAENFGKEVASAMSEMLTEYYRLGTIRKPETMQRSWAMSLSDAEATALQRQYRDLMNRAQEFSTTLPEAQHDAYFEMIGFPARVLAATGLIFMDDREAQLGINVASNESSIANLRKILELWVDQFNNSTAGGKWKGIMPGLVTGKNLMSWSSQVRWPWGEKTSATQPMKVAVDHEWRDAATGKVDHVRGKTANWVEVPGLGCTGHAMALLPATLQNSWTEKPADAPSLDFDFTARSAGDEAIIDFLPTLRIYPDMKLRVAVSVDGKSSTTFEIPGSSGAEDEFGTVRSAAVQDNYTRLRVPLHDLSAGKHTLTIRAVDPGVVIDRVSLPRE
jgi:hypothetical protein